MIATRYHFFSQTYRYLGTKHRHFSMTDKVSSKLISMIWVE